MVKDSSNVFGTMSLGVARVVYLKLQSMDFLWKDLDGFGWEQGDPKP